MAMRRIDDDSMETRSSFRERSNTFFYWFVFFLLLIAFVITCWIGSFYIFGHPEKPLSFKILTKLHKLDPIKLFEVTNAPPGEFLTANKILERYGPMSRSELALANDALLRNYLRNYKETSDLVPYIMGNFDVLDSYELTENDLIPSGVVAVEQSRENPSLLLEQLYIVEPRMIPLLQRTLLTGSTQVWVRSQQLSAIIHVQKLPDGKMKVTTVPMNNDSYEVSQGTGRLSWLPPKTINIEAGLPILSKDRVAEAEGKYLAYRRRAGLTDTPTNPSATPPPRPGAIQLVRVAPATAINPEKIPVKKAEPARVERATAAGTPLPAVALPPAVPEPTDTPLPGSPGYVPPPVVAGTETASPSPSPAIVATEGGNWPIYPAGRMPRGRLMNTGDMPDLATKGMSGERIYLQGNFVVSASGNGRAILRAQSAVGFIGRNANTRVIVEYPKGSELPSANSQFGRDARRPFLIKEVRKAADGTINVYALEITQP